VRGVSEKQRSIRLQALVKAPQRLEVLHASAPKPEGTAYEDRLVQAGRVELVHCLHEKRRRQPLARGLLAAELDHVRRDVATVDVEPASSARRSRPSSRMGSDGRPTPFVATFATKAGMLVMPEQEQEATLIRLADLARREVGGGDPVNASPAEHDDLGWFDVSQVADLPLAHSGYLSLIQDTLARLAPL
jgi:hypothetical protein